MRYFKYRTWTIDPKSEDILRDRRWEPRTEAEMWLLLGFFVAGSYVGDLCRDNPIGFEHGYIGYLKDPKKMFFGKPIHRFPPKMSAWKARKYYNAGWKLRMVHSPHGSNYDEGTWEELYGEKA